MRATVDRFGHFRGSDENRVCPASQALLARRAGRASAVSRSACRRAAAADIAGLRRGIAWPARIENIGGVDAGDDRLGYNLAAANAM